VLAALDPDSRQEPASLTKIMTAYGVFRALKKDASSSTDMVTISEYAWKQEGSRCSSRWASRCRSRTSSRA